MKQPESSKMFFTLERLDRRIREIYKYRLRDTINPGYVLFTECTANTNETTVYPNKNAEYKRMERGTRWKALDQYIWTKFDQLIIPDNWSDKKIVVRLRLSRLSSDWNKDTEGLVYLNNEPYKGVDQYHPEVLIPSDLAGKELNYQVRWWSGFEVDAPLEHELDEMSISWLDEKVDHLYRLARITLDTIKVLDEGSNEGILLMNALNEAINKIDWHASRDQDLTSFFQSLYDSNNLLTKRISEIEKHSNVVVNCIGHTHIDVAWLWRLKHTREKAARSFLTVLRLMEQYPHYKFLQSQPQLYEYIKNDYPEIYEQIKKRVKEGRWEVDGAMWVESDCNIPNGESLVRQILIGKTFMKEEFDTESKYLWLPDVFGYSWALPQILKKSGIDTFMTTKISWNQYNKIPHDTFYWKGIDGTEILTHFINTPTAWSDENSFFTTYNGLITPFTVKKIWDKYVDKEINNELLIAYGYGDGGGGVNSDMLESINIIADMPGLPHCKTQSAREYFDHLNQRIEKTDKYVHTWDGELYLEYHRGTYTSQAFIKKYNRKLEFLLRETEMLSIYSMLETNHFEEYQSHLLKDAWKVLLRNQFHDIIPGSSIKEVYEDAKIEYLEAEKVLKGIKHQSIDQIRNDEQDVYSIFSPYSWEITTNVYIEGIEDDGYFIIDNQKLDSQKTSGGFLVSVNLKPLCFTTIKFVKSTNDDNTLLTIKDQLIETNLLKITLDDHGNITSIFDKEANKNIIKDGEKANVLQMFVDKPMSYDAWDIDIYYQDSLTEVSNLKNVEVVENGKLRAVIRFVYKQFKSTITQDMIVYANSKRIDFETEVDWQERQTLLKVAFPVNIRSTKATYDIQYGNVERPTHWNTSWDYARFEVVGHKWADLSEGNYGVSLLNDSKYGYDIKGNIMRLTLLKSANHPDRKADYGYHKFTYSIYPHIGDWRVGNTEIEAWKINALPTVVRGYAQIKNGPLLKLDRENIIIDTIKKCEYDDSIIIRLHEYKGYETVAKIQLNNQGYSYCETDLMEKEISPFLEKEIKTTFTPYEIKTFKIKVK